MNLQRGQDGQAKGWSPTEEHEEQEERTKMPSVQTSGQERMKNFQFDGCSLHKGERGLPRSRQEPERLKQGGLIKTMKFLNAGQYLTARHVVFMETR